MLTPDVYYLDRRIVQEAATLGKHGYDVDIYLTNPALAPETTLRPGVRILPNPGASRRASGIPLRLRYLKSRLRESAPPLHRVLDWAQHVVTDRADGIVRGNVEFLQRQAPYELVFAHDVPVWPLGGRLKAYWQCRLIVDLHDIYPEMTESFSSASARRYWRSVEGRWIAEADAILCVNEAVSRYVKERYAPAAEPFVITNAVPYVDPSSPMRDTLRERYGIEKHTRIMLFAGVPRANMNLENLILGFEEASLDGWALAFLGVGPVTRRLQRSVEERHLGGRVFIGLSVPQADVVSAASTANVGVLPYEAVGYNHLIATPNKLFEYIQARLPILASRLPMVEAIINRHGIGGFADFSSPGSAARDIRRFADSTLPRIAPKTLERAAHVVSWESDEATLLAAVASARLGVVIGAAPTGSPPD